MLDQLGEEGDTVPGTSIVHRYPRRVLFLVSNTCATLCRFCTRKRMVSQPNGSVHKDEIERSIDYIANNKNIEDVLLSGGDPLTFTDERLDEILGAIRARAPHVRFLRMGSRMVVQLPTRVTPTVPCWKTACRWSTSAQPPQECAAAVSASRCCKGRHHAGPQTVCLKGVSDSVEVMRRPFIRPSDGRAPTTCTRPTWSGRAPHRAPARIGLRRSAAGSAVGRTHLHRGRPGWPGQAAHHPGYVREEPTDGSGTNREMPQLQGHDSECPAWARIQPATTSN